MGLVGGLFLLFNKKWSKTLEVYSVPFAAGVLITVSILGLLPEAIELAGEKALFVILLSFFGAYLFENLLLRIHHHGESNHSHHNYKSATSLVVIGDTIHNLIDGVAIGASFMISPGLGFITAFSTFLHEVPHEIGDFGILLKAGWEKKNIILVNLFSAAVTVIGAFSVVFVPVNEVLLGLLLSVSAGIFLYLGSVDFLPHATEGFASKPKSLVPLITGVLAMIFTLMAVPHGH